MEGMPILLYFAIQLHYVSLIVYHWFTELKTNKQVTIHKSSHQHILFNHTLSSDPSLTQHFCENVFNYQVCKMCRFYVYKKHPSDALVQTAIYFQETIFYC